MKRSPTNRTAVAPALYTPEQRIRRDKSRWTIVQGVLAPIQFAVCLFSIGLIQYCLSTGHGWALANASVILKTGLLFLIMVTGAIWEKEVFGHYLFAPAFFWEDVVSFVVILLHTAYLFAWLSDSLTPHQLMMLALVAYGAYFVNAGQFLLKLRAARLGEQNQQVFAQTSAEAK